MSIQAVKYVIEESPTYGDAWKVLLVLAYRANPDAISWPDQERIAKEARMRKSNVKATLELLIRCGELQVVSSATPRRSARLLLCGYLKSLNVGDPTTETPIGDPIENEPQTGVPTTKNASHGVPTELRGREQGAPIDTEGTNRALPLYQLNRQKRRNGTFGSTQGAPDRQFAVPTEFSGTTNLENRQGSVPAESGNANRQRQTPSVAASAPAPWGDGRDGEYFKEWYRLLNDGKTPEEARAALQSRAAGNGNGNDSSRPIPHYASAAEILAHVKRAAAGEEPFDFVDPKPAEGKT